MVGLARDLAVFSVLAVWLGTMARAQGTVGSDGCLRLLGSVACPGFQYAYVHPQNLSNAWPWLQGITTVSQFDVAALNYFVDPDQFQQTKFVNQLGCTNATGAVLQWERSVLCSQWVNSQWGRACTALYNGTSAATSQKMVCQSTCLAYSASERSIVNSTYCPGPDPTDGTREARLLKDYVDCTAWTTLATNNTDTCVQGIENEGNCGFGTSTAQLCGYCRGNEPDACCYQANVDQSVCGYSLPARASSSSSASSTGSSSSASPSGTTVAGQANSGTGNGTSLTNGQLAGTIVGSFLGGLLLLALLLLLLLCLRRRRRASQPENGRNRPHSGGAFSSLFGGSASGTNSAAPPATSPSFIGGPVGVGGPMSSSEKALLGAGPGGVSSPTMHSGLGLAGGGKGMMSQGSLGAAAAGAGAGVGAAGAAGLAASKIAGGGGRGGNVLPRVRDENQDGERFIEQGGEVTVLWPYTATLPDELDLRPGMRLRVVRLYDDAWGTGQVISAGDSSDGDVVGRTGAFPIVCVSEGSSFASSRSEESA